MGDFGFNAAIFDLDGVITKTASVHSAAWKRMFDEYLKDRSLKTGELFIEFRHIQDYLPYIDGKPRYKGVASFLKSRSIELPFGDPVDEPGKETICGLGNRKNELFNELIRSGNVEVFQSSMDFIDELKRRDIKIGVASSSKNCKTILEAVGLMKLFETRVDGLVSADLKLQGKPKPDIFTTAADNLGVPYDRTMVIEDAVSGVQAGRRGNFGLVLGVARENNAIELKVNGADIVVQDLSEIHFDDVENWFHLGLGEDSWTLSYFDYDREQEPTRESLLTIGNGFMGTRGALEECGANDINYPGTYIAGIYNRLESSVAGRSIENEDFVNCPNWLPITFRISEGDWLDPNEVEIVKLTRKLDFRSGLLSKEMVVRDDDGRETRLLSSRFASMAQPHLAALRYSITPLNYSDTITMRSGLDGNILNHGVERYRALNSRHLEPVKATADGSITILECQTSQSEIRIVEAVKLNVQVCGHEVSPQFQSDLPDGSVWTTFEVQANENETVHVEKIVAIHTSKDLNAKDPWARAQASIQGVESFDELLQATTMAWRKIWEKVDIQLIGDRWSQKLLRLNLYHTLVTASPHHVNLDAGIPARGLHGEAYRGHIFWDELYILPLYNLHFPEVTRSSLGYRYRRLDQARVYASEFGYEGAMFPWQSGSDGREETQIVHLNPISGQWGSDHSSLQRHVSLAIANNIWNYFWITEDSNFLATSGAEMYLEICRFWASKAQINNRTGRYDVDGVMGPDEYHEKYPDQEQGGLKNNAYTNIMVAWLLTNGLKLLTCLDENVVTKLRRKLELQNEELELWDEIRTGIQIPLSSAGVLEQFEGYFDLEELDWEAYRLKYGDIHRMDRILKAEGHTPDAYKVSKQADALMAFYVLGPDRVETLLRNAGYALEGCELLRTNFDYYLPRTSHGSTLSKLVHSYLAELLDRKELAWEFYQDALTSDYVDIQNGTTEEGIHTGVLAGSAILAMRSFAGLQLDQDELRLDPNLPEIWRELRFEVGFRGDRYEIVVHPEELQIRLTSASKSVVDLKIQDRVVQFEHGRWQSISLN